MTYKEAVKVIETEKGCVNASNDCGRDCASCHLVMEEHLITEAYELAIDVLKKAEKLEEEEQRRAEQEYERWVRNDSGK